FTIARNTNEYFDDVRPSEMLTKKIREMGVDVFTFIERKWCYTRPKTEKIQDKVNENVALLEILSFHDWWKKIGKKTRNMIRKAEKSGIETENVIPNEKIVEGIWRIYNETPIRQNRSFPHYGISLQRIQENIFAQQNAIYIGAYFDDELVGFIQLIYDSNFSMISQILSLKKYWNKAVNNALIAKAVHIDAAKGIKWLMYGRMGNHPSLDRFKRNNGFVKFPVSRYFIALTKRGKLGIKLGMHREMKDILPESIKYSLIPIYNWLSRTKLKIGLARK
ncbi:MAG: GNAT family N-acetyltransferase, partial [Candidatus Hodarchaeota archaeon]